MHLSVLTKLKLEIYTVFFFSRRRRNGKYAIGAACIGGGQGIAIIIENTP
jgi:acetyl-CoA acetyltransferase